MTREVQEPVAQPDPYDQGATRITHPAYAQIVAHRIHGGAGTLYGSDFTHQQSVRITIAQSHLKRSLSNDWYHAGQRLIDVDLSEAQWATFVSSLNIGHGVPATLRYVQGEAIPGIPAPTNRADQFAGELRAKLNRAGAKLQGLADLVTASGLSRVKQKELLDAIHSAHADIGSNAAFVAEQFEEHIENVTEAAKVEINAHATNLIARAGLQALGAKTEGPILELGWGRQSAPALPPAEPDQS